MFAGFAVPLGVLLLVVAGVFLGVHNAARRAAGTAAPAPPARQRSVAALRAGQPAASGMPLAAGGGTCAYRIAGTSYRQETLSDLRAALLRAPRRSRIEGRWDAFVAELRPEPENPHDPDAVAVDAPGHGTIGWLAHGDGAQYLALLRIARDRGLPLRCPAELRKGTDGAIGVLLDLASPVAVAAKLRVDLRDLAVQALAAANVHAPHAGTGVSLGA
jgi:hypothetical protein